MHWPKIHLPPGSHRNQRVVRPTLPPGVIGQWRGPNLLADGDAENPGVDDWTAVGGTISKGTTDPVQGTQTLTITQVSSSPSSARQTVLTAGTVYRLTGWVRCDGSTSFAIYDNGFELWFCAETTWTPFDITFLARGTDVRFYAIYGSASNYIDIDDLYLSAEPDGEENLLADGRMENPFPGWRLLSATGAVSKITDSYAGNYAMRLTRYTSVSIFARVVLQIGLDYRLTGVARGCGSCVPRVYDSAYRWTGTTSTSWQNIDITWTAGNATLQFYTSGGASGGYTDWDDLVLVQV